MEACTLTFAHTPQCSVNTSKLRLGVVYLTVRHPSRHLDGHLPIRLIQPGRGFPDGRSIILHGYEITSAERRPRLPGPRRIEKRMLETARPAKRPASLFFDERARALPAASQRNGDIALNSRPLTPLSRRASSRSFECASTCSKRWAFDPVPRERAFAEPPKGVVRDCFACRNIPVAPCFSKWALKTKQGGLCWMASYRSVPWAGRICSLQRCLGHS